VSVSFTLFVARTTPATPAEPPTWWVEHVLDFGDHKMLTADALVFGPARGDFSSAVPENVWQRRLPETVRLEMPWPYNGNDDFVNGPNCTLEWTRAGELILQWDAWWPRVKELEKVEDGDFPFELAAVALIRALPAATPIILHRC
jgi:hypothetical protein